MTRYQVNVGDCIETLAALPCHSLDSCVTDPPYHMTGVAKRFRRGAPVRTKGEADGVWARKAAGFMGQEWDGGDVAFRVETWEAVYRVLKPGAHLLAFGSTRGHHRMACAIEDAGFEIRDTLQWIYGSGFPKSLDVSKDLDRLAGAERKPCALRLKSNYVFRTSGAGRPQDHHGEKLIGDTEPATPEAAHWSGWGTALKPAHEPIILARVPLEEASIARQVLATGTGAINVDGCRVASGEDYSAKCASVVGLGSNAGGGVYSAFALDRVDSSHPSGRWPPNILLGHPCPTDACLPGCPVLDLGDRHRFFPVFRYCEKPSRSERERGLSRHETQTRNRVNPGGLENDPRWAPVQRKNFHPTVKPLALMRWLVRLVTPPGGTVLDPFTGSGTTGMAAMCEGVNFTGCELSPDYAEIARGRIEWTRDHGDEDEQQAEQADGQGSLFGGAS